jgi:hypothetical protein
MKNGKQRTSGKDDFIAPARRAFKRVAATLRAENKRLNLPLIFGEQGRVRLVKVSNTGKKKT